MNIFISSGPIHFYMRAEKGKVGRKQNFVFVVKNHEISTIFVPGQKIPPEPSPYHSFLCPVHSDEGKNLSDDVRSGDGAVNVGYHHLVVIVPQVHCAHCLGRPLERCTIITVIMGWSKNVHVLYTGNTLFICRLIINISTNLHWKML